MVGVGLLQYYSLSLVVVVRRRCCKRHLLRLQHATANNNYDQKDTYTHVVKTRRALRESFKATDRQKTTTTTAHFSPKSQ